jgi:hypothetical protein
MSLTDEWTNRVGVRRSTITLGFENFKRLDGVEYVLEISMQHFQQKSKLFGSKTVLRLISVLCKSILQDAAQVGEKKAHDFLCSVKKVGPLKFFKKLDLLKPCEQIRELMGNEEG